MTNKNKTNKNENVNMKGMVNMTDKNMTDKKWILINKENGLTVIPSINTKEKLLQKFKRSFRPRYVLEEIQEGVILRNKETGEEIPVTEEMIGFTEEDLLRDEMSGSVFVDGYRIPTEKLSISTLQELKKVTIQTAKKNLRDNEEDDEHYSAYFETEMAWKGSGDREGEHVEADEWIAGLLSMYLPKTAKKYKENMRNYWYA